MRLLNAIKNLTFNLELFLKQGLSCPQERKSRLPENPESRKLRNLFIAKKWSYVTFSHT